MGGIDQSIHLNRSSSGNNNSESNHEGPGKNIIALYIPGYTMSTVHDVLINDNTRLIEFIANVER